ncbi:MAG: hypothetical protein GYB65_22280 [Chloroflexi bacterium]|nr:hypothetical protein [Chloroflexota bacterium]
MKRATTVVLLALTLVVVLGLGGTSAAQSESRRPQLADGELVFVSERDGNAELYAMQADGSNLRRLTNNPALDAFPTWSPDGARIAFMSERDGNAELYVMQADGSNVVRLTDNPASDSYPAWSSDGTQIAFVSTRDGSADIYVMGADGSNVQRLTTDPGSDSYPAWSSDGSQIAFVSNRGGTSEIYSMNPDGSGGQPLTNLNGANGWFPTWSPVGDQMGFVGARNEQYQIFVMSMYTGLLAPVRNSDAFIGRLDWSPDAQWIAFVNMDDGNAELYVIDPTGTTEYRLTNNPASDYWPDWRPSAAVVVPAPAADPAPVADAPPATDPAQDVTCLVNTDQPDIRVHVGPGRNRNVFTYLPTTRDFLVTGQGADDVGNPWFQLDKTQIEGSAAVNELWVAAEDVNQVTACAAVPVVGAPPIIPGGPVATGTWGPCGSCDSCGYNPNECVTSPTGECLWDPRTCQAAPPPSGDDDDDSDWDGSVPCLTLTVRTYGPGTYSISPPQNCPGGWTQWSFVYVTAIPGLDAFIDHWSGSCYGMDFISNPLTQKSDMRQSCSMSIYFGGGAG